MATWTMTLLTPHDSSVMSSLVQYSDPTARRKELFDQLEEPAARMVAEAYFDDQKYAEAPADVRATVDHLRAWVQNNRHRRAEARRRPGRVR